MSAAAMLVLGPHELTIEDAKLTLGSLWTRWPTWALRADVRLPTGASVRLRLGGELRSACAWANVPAELAGSTWSLDARRHDGIVLGVDGCFELSGTRVELRLLDADDGHPLVVEAEAVEGRPVIRITCEGMAELHDADEGKGSMGPQRQRMVVRADADVDRMYPFEAARGTIWPAGARAELLAEIRRGGEAYLERPSAERVCHDYRTRHEGAGTGSVVVGPNSGEPLLVSGMRLLRAYVERSCRYWLPDEHGGRVDVMAAWYEEILPMIVAGLLGEGHGGEPRVESDARGIQERVDWIRGVLTREFARRTFNRALEIVVDRERVLRGKEAMRFAWPLEERVELGVVLRDRWNDKVVLVRTATKDGVVVWSTGA